MLRTLSVLALAAAAYAGSNTSPSWLKVGRAPADQIVEFRVALPKSNVDQLNEVFEAVTTPGSPRYGQYLSAEQLNAMTATPGWVSHSVLSWLSRNQADCKLFSSSIKCRASVSDVERMLGTEMHTFQHAKTGDRIHRVGKEVTFPAEMYGKVEFISGLNGFPVEHLGKVRSVESKSKGHFRRAQAGTVYTVPETLTTMYGTAGAKGDASVTQAPVEFQDYPAYADSDLTTFIQQTAISTFKVAKHVGPFDQSNPQPESTLDIQYIGAVGTGNTNWYWTEAQWLYDFSESVLAAGANGTPDVFSMSYGWSEADQCQISPSAPSCANGDSTAFVQAVNVNFQKIGASGVTMLASSGDSGAHGRTDPLCQDPKLRPAFPAASPYVTAVGATQFKDGTVKTGGSSPFCQSNTCAVSGTEIVCSPATGALIASGGGFSNVASQPSWQKTVVSKYVSGSGVPPAGDFNATGRGYPDVAALGHYYYIQMSGEALAVDGTSCSCPVFAGVIGLLNAERVKSGKPKIGFANPMLYQMYAQDATAFNDITDGNNFCTESSCSCTTGYKATTGWDATTGLGTPNFPKMKAAMAAIDARNGL